MTDLSSFGIGNASFINVLLFIIVFSLASFISNLISIVIGNFFKPRIKGSYYRIPGKVVQYLLMFTVAYLGLRNILGFDLTAFLAAFGIVGIAVAFSAQQTIQNFIAGIFILGGGIIKLDEWIEVSGLPDTGLCQVKDISLTKTTLREDNGRLVGVPNSLFISNKIVKYPTGDFFKSSFSLKISPENDIEKTQKLIVDVCNKNSKILPNIPIKEKSVLKKILKSIPKGGEDLLPLLQRRIDISKFRPMVLVTNINDNKVTLEVSVWFWEIENKEKIISVLMKEILKELSNNNIK